VRRPGARWRGRPKSVPSIGASMSRKTSENKWDLFRKPVCKVKKLPSTDIIKFNK